MTDDEEEKSAFSVTFSGLQVITAPSDHYLDVDWNTILLAPLWVFEAVASSDGTIDDKERAAFMATLDRPPPGMFSAFVFAHVRRHMASLTEARSEDGRKPKAGIADVQVLLARYPDPAEADAFRRSLVDLARNVANASGGVLGMGKKTSDDEAAVIKMICALLHIADVQ